MYLKGNDHHKKYSETLRKGSGNTNSDLLASTPANGHQQFG